MSPLECVSRDCNGTQVPPPSGLLCLALLFLLLPMIFFTYKERVGEERLLGRERSKVTYKVSALCEFPALESRAR